jgi:hypothetical protein
MAVTPSPAFPTIAPAPKRNAPTEDYADIADAWAADIPKAGAAMQAIGDAAEANGRLVEEAAETVTGQLSQAATIRNQIEGFAQTAVNAPGTKASVTTSLTFGTGLKTLPVPGKLFAQGQTVSIALSTDGTKRMVGPIRSYDPSGPGTMEVMVESVPDGTGTHNSWVVALSPPGSIPVAAPEDVFAGNDNGKAVTSATLAGARKYRDLVNGATIPWNVLTQGYKTKVVLTSGSHTLDIPSGLREGDVLGLVAIQPASGSAASIIWPGAFKFGLAGTPVMPTANNAWSIVRGEVLSVSPLIIDAKFTNLGVP